MECLENNGIVFFNSRCALEIFKLVGILLFIRIFFFLLATFSGWVNFLFVSLLKLPEDLALFCECLTWPLCLLKRVSDLHRFQHGAHGWDRAMQSQSTAYQQNQQRGGGGGWRPPQNQQDSRRGGQQQVWPPPHRFNENTQV